MMTTTPQNPNYRRGDIVLVLFPNSNLRTAKTRPALVVQRDDLNSGLAEAVVCMITSKGFRSNHSSRVMVVLNSPEGRETGLLTDSIVMTDNLATIALSEIDRAIGRMPMSGVDAALRHTLGL